VQIKILEFCCNSIC